MIQAGLRLKAEEVEGEGEGEGFGWGESAGVRRTVRVFCIEYSNAISFVD